MIALLCGLALAKDVPFDSGVIAGLQARNIGTAETSGRISALAAWNDSWNSRGFMTLPGRAVALAQPARRRR